MDLPLASSTISIQAARVSFPSRTVLHPKTWLSSSPLSRWRSTPTRPSSLRQTPPALAPCPPGSCLDEPVIAIIEAHGCLELHFRIDTFKQCLVVLEDLYSLLTIIDILRNFFFASSTDASGSICSTSKGLRFLRFGQHWVLPNICNFPIF